MDHVDFTRPQTLSITISPELAEDWLDRNTHNRPIRSHHVAELAHDMRLGRWRMTHQGIAFDVHGRLADGQHRLLAVVMSGVTVRMLVTTMVDVEACGVIDTCTKRTIGDAMSLSGRGEMVKGGGGGANSNASMWKMMMCGMRGAKHKITNEALFRFSDSHGQAGMFALIEFGKHPRIKSIHVAPVMAAIGRSYYTYRGSLPKVQRFVALLCTGMGGFPGSSDEVPLKLRNWLVNAVLTRNSNNAGEVYGKTAAALNAFIDDRRITKLYQPEAEPYPLPEERALPADAGRADRMAFDFGREGAGRPRVDRLATREAH